MSKYSKRIPIPSPQSINSGLTSPLNKSVIAILGRPEKSKAKSLLATVDVGPFKVYGNKLFLAALKRVFAKVKAVKPELYEAVKTAGCYNLRPVRGSTTAISDHGWGNAIDLYFGDAVTPRGSDQTEQGLLELYPFMHEEKIYWGAEFKTDDGMHFGASLELMQEWDKEGLV